MLTFARWSDGRSGASAGPATPAVEMRGAATSAPLVVSSAGVVELSIELHGEASDRQHVVEWIGLPVGRYEVLGTLVDAAGHERVVVRGYLRVIA
ncbi:MAG: hypothetical protein OXH75_19365 [Acidobacteria bacterium]|nr:hypothetical protein [Acidobacteriota bacterium]